MDFFEENLKLTINAINKSIEKNRNTITNRRVKMLNKISVSNRSKTSFISYVLRYLTNEGILEVNGVKSPKTYLIKPKDKINIEEFASKISKTPCSGSPPILNGMKVRKTV